MNKALTVQNIRLRGWDSYNKKMWYFKTSEIFDNGIWFSPEDDGAPDDHIDDKNMILMLSTGKFDRSGKEIYDGDIVEIDWNDRRYTSARRPVSWNEHYAAWDFGGGVASEVQHSHTVVGNIYQNPNIMKTPEHDLIQVYWWYSKQQQWHRSEYGNHKKAYAPNRSEMTEVISDDTPPSWPDAILVYSALCQVDEIMLQLGRRCGDYSKIVTVVFDITEKQCS